MSNKTAIQAVGVTSIAPDIEAIEQLIRDRAYQRFMERGSEPGSPLEDWLSAESALFSRPGVKLTEEGKAIIAELDISSVSPERIDLKTDGKFLLVRASAPQGQQDSQQSPASPELFCVVEFPREIDKDAIRAEYRQGTLRIVGSSQSADGTLQMTA